MLTPWVLWTEESTNTPFYENMFHKNNILHLKTHQYRRSHDGQTNGNCKITLKKLKKQLYNEAPVELRLTHGLVWYGSLALQVLTRTRTSPSARDPVNPDGSYWGGKYRRGPDKIKISGADKGKVTYWWSRPQSTDTRYLLFKNSGFACSWICCSLFHSFFFLFQPLSGAPSPPCRVKLGPLFTVCQTDKYGHPYNHFCGLL